MTRKGLQKHAFQIRHYYADVIDVSAFSRKFSDPVPAICLGNVRLDKANIVTDHAWINPSSMYQTEPFPVQLAVGDTISFSATVTPYEKSRYGDRWDYGLSGIKYIVVITKAKGEVPCKSITAD